ncbi:hypothetical protein LguiA_028638 [Lonicera macranthoides]
MSSVGEEELEYESDPEEAKLLLKMRRREASDDEDEEEAEEDGEEEERDLPPRRTDSRAGIVSGYESDGQGAPADYDEEGSEIEEEYEDAVEESVGLCGGEVITVGPSGEEFDGDVGRFVGMSTEVLQGIEEKKENEEEFVIPTEELLLHANDDDDHQIVNSSDGGGRDEEKKENEPFAVPTAGAFYMHDDRFRDSAGASRHRAKVLVLIAKPLLHVGEKRKMVVPITPDLCFGYDIRYGWLVANYVPPDKVYLIVGWGRRTLGGKKLWESKDNRKWGHDKFEEMATEESHYDDGRRAPRVRYRGHGKNRGDDRGFPRGNKSKVYNNNNQNNAAKSVRGRGPRRYQPSFQNNSEAPTQKRQPGRSIEKTSYASSDRVSAPASKVESVPVSSRKHVFASSLSVASPPFYPSGSSSKEITYAQKRDLLGKNVADSITMDKLYIDDSISIPTVKPLTNLQLPPPSLINSTESPQLKVQGRGGLTLPLNPVRRISPPTQLRNVQRTSVQSQFRPSLQATSPPKAALSVSSFESGEVESLLDLSKPKSALVGKGKGNVQCSSGRSSFPYGGGQVMGASVSTGGGHGDQNFPATPAFLPVMQFGSQHSSGMGVPAVGMAFPGYVAQQQLGLGKSEMTCRLGLVTVTPFVCEEAPLLPKLWGYFVEFLRESSRAPSEAGKRYYNVLGLVTVEALLSFPLSTVLPILLPVLAGAAGGLGAAYCSPYLAVDGAYHTASGQTSSLASISSKENNTSKPGNKLKSSQRLGYINGRLGGGLREFGAGLPNSLRYIQTPAHAAAVI